MTGLSQDIRFTARTMAKSPAFAAIAILTLALGIGANSAIFSVVNAVLLRPLPLQDPDRLLVIWAVRLNYDRYAFRIPDFIDFRDRNRAFSEVAAYGNFSANLTGEANPQRLQGMRVTGNLFEMLGARAEIGRTIVPDDDNAGKAKVVVLSHGLWQRHYGSDPGIVGKKITLGGEPFTVAGVLAGSFVVPGQAADVMVPMLADADPFRHNRSSISFLRVFGRLKPGITQQQAKEDLNTIASQLKREYPKDWDATINVVPMRDEIVGNVQLMLLVILSAVGMVLLIACANMASFLLAKAAARRRELAIRTALGGTRSRLIRQLLTESMLLALAGGGLGVLFAAWGVSGLVSLLPATLPRTAEIHVDARMFGLAFLISILSGLLFGLLPAVEASAADFNEALRSDGRTSPGSQGRNRLRRVLVIGEVAVSLVLLIGAGLLLKSFMLLRDLNPGFDSRHVLSARLALPSKRYPTREAIATLHDKIQSRLASLPGVESVGSASIAPLSGPLASTDFQIAGRPALTGKDVPTAQYRMIDPGYLAALRVPIQRGRNFSAADTEHAPLAVIISESIARAHWRDGDPIGAHILMEDDLGRARDLTIVGVAGDVRQENLENPPTPCVYVAMAQIPNGNARWIANNMFWLIRTSGEISGLGDTVRRQIQEVDPDVAAASIQPFDQYLVKAVESRRFSLSLIVAFAGAALLLAASGVYALIANLVVQRTREIGVRIALGAQPRNIFWQVAGEGVLLTSAGAAIGLGAAFILVRLISSMLYGVTSHDIVTMLEVSAVLIATGGAASYFPARRAVNVDPVIAMRE